MHRSGQFFFLPHAKFKQRDKASGSSFFLHSNNLYVGKSKWIHMIRSKDTIHKQENKLNNRILYILSSKYFFIIPFTPSYKTFLANDEKGYLL